MVSKLFKFANIGSQGGVRAGLELLDTLQVDRRIVLPRESTGFMHRVTGMFGVLLPEEQERPVLDWARGVRRHLSGAQGQDRPHIGPARAPRHLGLHGVGLGPQEGEHHDSLSR